MQCFGKSCWNKWFSLLVCGVIIWKSKLSWWNGFSDEVSQSLFSTDKKCECDVNGFDFDISSLEGQILSYNDINTGLLYSYTPCKNDLRCGSSKKDYMVVVQTTLSNCHELTWCMDQIGFPKYKSSDGSYNLHYYTGCESGQNFTQFACVNGSNKISGQR